jgi:serine/threonine protein kinase
MSDATLGEDGDRRAPDLGGAVLLDRFKLVRLLGRGGMGAVYEARDLLLDTTVALKLLAQGDGQSTTLEQLRREVLLARRVTHVNVARLFDCYEAPEGLFLTMEYLEGETLAQRTSRPPSLTLPERLESLRQICSGVEAIHAQGIVHRDLKPSNVFLTRSGPGLRAVVTDFGIAHADPYPTLAERFPRTGTGVVVGTPRYMAPEQLRGEPVTPRADVFALGVVAAELLEDVRPTRRALARTFESARADDPLRRPGTPGELLSSIERALRRPWFRRRAGVLSGVIVSLVVATLAWSAWRVHQPAGSSYGDQPLATAKGQKLYTQGVERLRALDYVGARDLLEGAVTVEPASPTARAALARAWWSLGYSSKAKVLAREAFEASLTGPPIQRTRIEALYRKMSGDSPKAEDLFQTAFTASRSVEDALDLASVQPAGKAFELLTGFSNTLHPGDQRVDLALSEAAWRLGRFDEARASAVAVEAVAREQHLPFLLAGALRAQARVIYETDAPRPQAFAKLDAASAILKEAGDLGAVADIECDKALVLASLGTTEQSEESRRHLESGISLFRRLGNSERAYWWLSSIASQMLSLGRLADVQSLMREARDEIDPTGEPPEPSFWVVTSWLAMYTGDLPTAQRDLAKFRSGTATTEIMPRPSGVILEGELLREEDHLVEAHSFLETWLRKGQSTGARTIITDVPVRLARLDSDLGHPDPCLQRLELHERAGHELGPLFMRFQGPIQARCLLQKGDIPAARRVAELGLAAATASGFFTWRIFNGLALARADAADKKFPEAEKRIRPLIAEAREHGHVLALFESRLALGDVEVLARSPSASATLKELEDEAREKGFLRIARLAREARAIAQH